MAMVLDRLFLWIFTMAVVVGTAGIILQAPSLYDDRSPIDKELSDIGQQVEEILSTIHLYFGSRLPIYIQPGQHCH